MSEIRCWIPVWGNLEDDEPDAWPMFQEKKPTWSEVVKSFGNDYDPEYHLDSQLEVYGPFPVPQDVVGQIRDSVAGRVRDQVLEAAYLKEDGIEVGLTMEEILACIRSAARRKLEERR